MKKWEDKIMKKIVAILMVVMNIVALGAVKSELKKDSNGRYSGSASLKLVARGRIVKPVSTEMLVINSGENNSIEFNHKGLKGGESKESKGKFTAQILEKDENGNYVVAKNRSEITAKLVDRESLADINNSERAIKNLEGKDVAKVAYGLKETGNKNGYTGEISSKLLVGKENKGIFIDNSTAVAILVK